MAMPQRDNTIEQIHRLEGLITYAEEQKDWDEGSGSWSSSAGCWSGCRSDDHLESVARGCTEIFMQPPHIFRLIFAYAYIIIYA